MTFYHSPIVFGQFTATMYIPFGILYLYVNPLIGVCCILLAALSLILCGYLHGGKAFIVCISTGCIELYLIISLMTLGYITELMTLLLIGVYMVMFGVYCVSAFDAIMDDYMFEVLTGKLCCLPKYSCYQVGVRIVGSSICELGDKLLWNERYTYIRDEYDGRMNTVDNWVNDVDPDITYESNNIVVNMWVLDTVDKYW